MQKYLHDQRGIAVVFELLLLAVVLSVAGLAVYQANHRQQAATTRQSSQAATPSSVQGLAVSAAAVLQEESDTDAQLGAEAEGLASEVAGSDADMANLGGSIDENAF